jgi:hypothetical protein
MSGDGVVRTGILFSASHPRVGLYWNFLRFFLQIDDYEMQLDWKDEPFIAVLAGRHEISVVGRPITGVGPKRAKAKLAVDVPFNQIVRVHYQGPLFALALLGWLPPFRAKLTATSPMPAPAPPRNVKSTVEELDGKGPD